MSTSKRPREQTSTLSGNSNDSDDDNRFKPSNSFVTPLLTDMYQISMTYAHWKAKRCDDDAVFDLFFRKNPFHGEFCVFAGSDEILRFLASYRFTISDVEYLKTLMPQCEKEFFDWLLTVNCDKVKIYCMQEGSIVFPREPLLRIEGPLAITQLLETTLLNLTNFPSLVATNAARMRLAAESGPNNSTSQNTSSQHQNGSIDGQQQQPPQPRKSVLMEFGLRRAQGPDGGISASKYCYVGGFDGTSNVLAGKLFGLDVKGTHAHAYVMSHIDLEHLYTTQIKTAQGKDIDFVALVKQKRSLYGSELSNNGELAAFIEYAQAFPNGFLALVDTYDTLHSGVPNFIAVAVALHEIGYQPRGIRLDSGDLAYLSKQTRARFVAIDQLLGYTLFEPLNIVASNDINEEVLRSLNREGHSIDTFGIGTHLVTCYQQPALGCVYKLVEINNTPRIKLSQEVEKLVIPGKKSVYRLYGKDGKTILDLIQLASEPAPTAGCNVMCRHPFQENKRAMVTPTLVQPLLQLIWDEGKIVQQDTYADLEKARNHCLLQIHKLRNDHIRALNPTPYKVSVSQALYDFLHQLWAVEAPIAQLD